MGRGGIELSHYNNDERRVGVGDIVITSVADPEPEPTYTVGIN